MNHTVVSIDHSSREGPPLTAEASAGPPRLITPTYSPSEELLRKYCRYADIEEKYHIEPEVLGIGHHGSVRRCVHCATGQRYAVKSINKMEPNVSVPGLVREMALLGEVKHDSVIRFIEAFEDFEHVHIVTELCEGGELFDKIAERNSADNGAVCFAEDEAARILHQVLSAVAYLHEDLSVAHRDLKPENILFATKEEGSPIKIIDLGLSRKHHPDEPPMTSFVGTSYYVAPEVLRQRYDKASDLWSIGVITYLLLCGYPPFNGETNTEVYKSVYRGQFCFPIEDWKDISIEAMHFIHRLLTKDPTKRMTTKQALEHPWIRKHVHVDTDVAMDEEVSGANANVVVSERRSSGEVVHGGCAQRIVEEALEQFGGEGGICGAVFDMDL